MRSIPARHGASCAAITSVAFLAALAASWVAAPTRANAEIASGCTLRATRAAVASFVSAFDSGDYRRLDGLFAGPALFQWYSSSVPGLRMTTAARNRSSLAAYFRARHSQRDRLRLVAFTFTSNSYGYGNFVFKMRRSAADYHKGAWFGLVAKGAAVCSDLRLRPPVQFIVMSVGGPNSA